MSERPLGIVVGVDGSAVAETAAEWAARESVVRKQPLLLASAYVVPQFLYAEGMVPSQGVIDELREQATKNLDDATAVVHAKEPTCEVLHSIVEGSPIEMLLDMSKKAALVVVGSRGLGGVAGALLGSVSSSLVSHAHSPVVVVRDNMDTPPEDGPVVVGVDGSAVSYHALREAFAVANAHSAPLIAVNAWVDRAAKSSIAGLSLLAEDHSRAQREQEAMVEDALSVMRQEYPDVKVTTVIREETPELALSAMGKGARMIVVGSHGRGGFSGMLLGSTSRALLRLSPCPLMVVRWGAHGTK